MSTQLINPLREARVIGPMNLWVSIELRPWTQHGSLWLCKPCVHSLSVSESLEEAVWRICIGEYSAALPRWIDGRGRPAFGLSEKGADVPIKCCCCGTRSGPSP